ncbi:MAG: thioredoxin-disulfide reductase [Candidatus Buchananbacteria bacterium]
MNENQFDVIIVGAGPAGLTAGLYASRRDLKTLIVSKNLGGQAVLSHEIENFPGFEAIDGISLIQKMSHQVLAFGAEIKYGEVKEIKKNKAGFIVKFGDHEFECKTVILALGLLPKTLDVAGEKKLLGRGVCYCATCDGPLYRNKIVAVVGGGNSALGAAQYLSGLAKQVYLIHRREEFRGEEYKVKELKKTKNVTILLNTDVVEIKGQHLVESLVLKDKTKNENIELGINGMFIEIGYSANIDFLNDLVQANKNKEIITDKNTKTSCSGIFACGDVTDVADKQMVISAGEGAKAALEAYRFIHAQKSAKAEEKVLPDWE